MYHDEDGRAFEPEERATPTHTRHPHSLWKNKSSWKLFVMTISCILFGYALGKYWRTSCPMLPVHSFELFELNETFTMPPSPVTDAAWKNLIPVGRGFVVIDDNGDPFMYNGTPADLFRIRAVSVFHQLHCLNELRIGFYSQQHQPGSSDSIPYAPTSGDHHHSVAHMKHCFDYLRQSLMCAADTTLESLQSDGGQILPSVDGWGSTHECRSFNDVVEWTVKHRASDSGGI